MNLNETLNKIKSLMLLESLEEIKVPIDSETFNLETFKSLKKFSQRVKYCDQNLPRISSGSSRIVYRLNDTKVLKLAKNEKGIAQNSVESDWALHSMFDHIVSEVPESDENDLWVVAELAMKTTPKRFKEIIGIDLESLRTYLTLSWNYHNRYGTKYTDEEAKLVGLYDENEFLVDLKDLMLQFDLPPGDLCRISSYGEVVRNGKPAIILIDYGLNNENYQSYYS